MNWREQGQEKHEARSKKTAQPTKKADLQPEKTE